MSNKTGTYIAAIITIIAIVSSLFIYLSFSSQINNLQSQNAQISVVDDYGYVTNLTSTPQRIVSLAPSATQICFAIGVGDKVVAVTGALNSPDVVSEDYPYNFTAWVVAGNMTFDGAYGTPNLEAVASALPDLIIADSQCDAQSIATLRDDGYKVIVLNPTIVTGIEQDIDLVGRATGAQAQAASLDTNISSTITNISTKIADANITTPVNVYFEVWSSTTGYISVGGTTWISDAIHQAGGTNIFANVTDPWPTVDQESIITLNPNVIILDDLGVTTADVQARTGWNTISALQNNQIYVVNEDLFSEPGPRIGILIQDLAACLYPQLFNSTS